MSEDFVTRAELQAFQEKVEQQMQIFMAEVRSQSSDFVTEVRAGIETMRREGREGRAEILASNRSIGERVSVLIQNVDRFSADVERTKNQYDRAAEGLAARVDTLEREQKRKKPRGGRNA